MTHPTDCPCQGPDRPGVNAPELNTPDGQDAKTWVLGWLNDHGRPGILLRTIRDRTEKYGRWLGTIHDLADTRSLNADLIAAGRAVAYPTP
jgi:endonuclease YncB( thermonuclease family)